MSSRGRIRMREILTIWGNNSLYGDVIVGNGLGLEIYIVHAFVLSFIILMVLGVLVSQSHDH